MNKSILLEAVIQLHGSDLAEGTRGRFQAVRQFNALLAQAKSAHPSRADIACIEEYANVSHVGSSELRDAALRLLQALQLRRSGSSSDIAESIQLPPDAPAGLEADLLELKEAVGAKLKKTPLLLAGAIAEALLLLRHPDRSERGPGLSTLLSLAKAERLFGRDTLRQLETLNDYRDLIHTRAGPRNKIELNDARVEQAVMALKLLCSELIEEDVRYSSPRT